MLPAKLLHGMMNADANKFEGPEKIRVDIAVYESQ